MSGDPPRIENVDERLYVACAADQRYVPYCAAMIRSLSAHHSPERIHVHFLHDVELPPELLRRLSEYVSGLGIGWSPLVVDDARRALFPDHGHFSRTAWYRVLLPQLLTDLERVLYLDSDLIVAGSLDELWTTDLGGHALAAVTNPLYPGMSTTFLGRLGLPNQSAYFNSGVMLIDLADWRRTHRSEEIIRFMERTPSTDWPDQDALNAVLWKERLHLPPRWNAQNTVFELKPSELPFSLEDVEEARARPAVVHFSGPYKPWHYRSKHPLRDLYSHHAGQTPWAGHPIEGRTPIHRLLRLLPVLFGYRVDAFLRRVRKRIRNMAGR